MIKYALLLLFFITTQALAFTTGQNATLVIGHSDFVTGGTIHVTHQQAHYIPE